MQTDKFTADLNAYSIAELTHIIKALVGSGTALEAFSRGPEGSGLPALDSLLTANDQRIEAAVSELQSRAPEDSFEAGQRMRGLLTYSSITAEKEDQIEAILAVT